MGGYAREQLITWLEGLNQQVKTLEAEAAGCLEASDYASVYKDIMTRKAKLLACAPDMFAAEFPQPGNPEAAELSLVKDRLQNFASSAATALELNSTFYMSALLYPDDHQTGQPNNLELFIAGLK